jgi:type IV fimbrial biogenesis protein FimT
MNTPRRPRGITLVEAMVCTGLTASLAAFSAGSFTKLREHRQIESAAALFETDMQHARSLAVSMNSSVRITFKRRAEGSCYVVHTGDADDCDCAAAGETVCTGTAQAVRGVGYAAGAATARMETASSSILIDATRGTVTPTATVKFIGASGAAVHQVVSIMGRTRTCSPGKSVPGHPAC